MAAEVPRLSASCGLFVLFAAFSMLGQGESFGTLNLHELSELKYGIEIGAEPVMVGQVKRFGAELGWVERNLKESKESAIC